jgi:TolB protein
MNADGSRMRQLTNLDDDINPSLSPDGTRIAFRSRRRDGNDEIYVINSDGSNLARLTNNPGENTAPTWSPDGSQIAFMSNLLAPNDPAQIFMYVMGADGSNPHRLTQSSGFDPHWSLDGSQIVFVTSSNNLASLRIMNADGTHDRVIKTNPAEDIESPVWSPDGTQIAFLSQKTLNDPVEVDVIGADGKNQHSLTPRLHVVFGGLSWSPDGQKLLFSMHGDGKSLTGALQLYIVDADGSDLHKLEVSCAYCYDANWGH